MKGLTITLISDKLSILDTQSIPLIVEVVNSFNYIKGFYNKENIILIHGFELASKIEVKASFMNYKIKDRLYWFYSEDELEESKIYQFEIKKFIFEVVFKDLLTFNKTIIWNFEQLKSYESNKVLLFQNSKTNTCWLYESISNKIGVIDLNYFSFILSKNITSIENLLPNNQYYSLSDVKLNLKRQGLVDKRYIFENLLDYFKYYNYESDDINEYYYYLILVLYSFLKYKSTEPTKEVCLFSSYKFHTDLNKFNDFNQNIFFFENYLSNVEIKSIDLNLYTDLNFPVKNNKIQYSYNGSNTTTGRIYPISIEDYQSLQTLKKEQRDCLNAEPNCFLIEFDFNSFEFDLLLQFAGFEIKEDLDPHTEIIKELFGDHFTIEANYRDLGKKINYSLIYGMKIEKIVENLFEDFEQDLTEEEMTENSLLEYKSILKLKLEHYKFVEAVNLATEKIINEYYNPETFLLRNYFGRFIRIEKSHTLLNYFLQSTASDILYLKSRLIIDLLEINKVNKKNKIILQNHDSLLLQIENDLLNHSDLFEKILDIMKADINGLNFRVKFSYGKNWKKLV